MTSVSYAVCFSFLLCLRIKWKITKGEGYNLHRGTQVVLFNNVSVILLGKNCIVKNLLPTYLNYDIVKAL